MAKHIFNPEVLKWTDYTTITIVPDWLCKFQQWSLLLSAQLISAEVFATMLLTL